jgi:hypothetical protein
VRKSPAIGGQHLTPATTVIAQKLPITFFPIGFRQHRDQRFEALDFRLVYIAQEAMAKTPMQQRGHQYDHDGAGEQKSEKQLGGDANLHDEGE